MTRVEEWEEGVVRENVRCQAHSAVFKVDNQQGPTVQCRELSSRPCGSLDGREIWERMGSCTCMAESLGCASDSIANIINCLYANIKLKNF